MRFMYVLCRYGRPVVICNSYENAWQHKTVEENIREEAHKEFVYTINDVPYSYYPDKTYAIVDGYKGYRTTFYKYYYDMVNRLGVFKGCLRLLGVVQEMEDKHRMFSRHYDLVCFRMNGLKRQVKQLEEFNEALIQKLKEHNIYVDI